MNDNIIHRVLINCPKTGEPVNTVYRLRPTAFEALNGQYAFRCARCCETVAPYPTTGVRR